MQASGISATVYVHVNASLSSSISPNNLHLCELRIFHLLDVQTQRLICAVSNTSNPIKSYVVSFNFVNCVLCALYNKDSLSVCNQTQIGVISIHFVTGLINLQIFLQSKQKAHRRLPTIFPHCKSSCAKFKLHSLLYDTHGKRTKGFVCCPSPLHKQAESKAEKLSHENMLFAKRSVSSMAMVLMTVCILLTVTQITEAGYRKPPFNGSIFGKRSGNSIGSTSKRSILAFFLEKNTKKKFF